MRNPGLLIGGALHATVYKGVEKPWLVFTRPPVGIFCQPDLSYRLTPAVEYFDNIPYTTYSWSGLFEEEFWQKLENLSASELKFPEGSKKSLSAAEFLGKAEATLIQRGKDYDKTAGERSMERIVSTFNALTGHKLTETEGWTFMVILKQVRLLTAKGPHFDSALDMVSYAALAAEANAKENVK